MILNDIQPFILIDQCLVRPLSKKLPPSADRNKYRDPQTDSTQRVRNLRTGSPKKDVSIKSLPRAQESLRSGHRKSKKVGWRSPRYKAL